MWFVMVITETHNNLILFNKPGICSMYHHIEETKKCKICRFRYLKYRKEIEKLQWIIITCFIPHNNSTKMHQRPTKREIEMAILSYRNTNPAQSLQQNE